MDFQFLPCRSTLYSKSRCSCKCSFPFASWLWLTHAGAAMPASIASTLVSRALAFPPWPYGESHNTHTHFQFGARSANRIRESIHNKNNLLGLRAQSGTGGYVRLTESNGDLSQSPMGNLTNLHIITLDDRSTGQLCRAAVHPFSPMMTLASSAVPFPLVTTAIYFAQCMRQGVVQGALVRLSQP